MAKIIKVIEVLSLSSTRRQEAAKNALDEAELGG